MDETIQQHVARLIGLVGSRDPTEVLRDTAPRLGALIASRSDDDLRWTTSPARWSTAAILAHLADAEIVTSYRVRMILAAPGTAIQAFDQDRWAEAFRYTDQDPFASLALFRQLRNAWLRLVGSVDPGWLDRYGLHEERGHESVRHLITFYAGHDLNHIAQVEALLREADAARGSGAPPFEQRPIKAVIANDVLQQVDVRVGTIRSITALPGTDRLMKLVVHFGDRDRVVIAGIKQERWYPQSLAGRQALFVVNITPRRLHGETSEAMLFDIGFDDGVRPALAEPEWPMPDGARV